MNVLAVSAQNGIWKNEIILTTHRSKKDFFPLLSVQVCDLGKVTSFFWAHL